MNLNFQLPINTRLADVNFAIQYKLIEQGSLTVHSHTQALTTTLLNIVKRARDENKMVELDDGLAQFFADHSKDIIGTPSPKSAKKAMPLASRVDAFLEKHNLFSAFQRTVEFSPLQHMWAASYIPQFFLDNPINGLETVVTSDEYDAHAPKLNTLIFSVPHVNSVCMQAGYIKAPMKIRVAVAKGDLGSILELRELLAFFQLNASKAERVKFADGVTQYEITISMSHVDKEFHRKSKKALDDLITLYHLEATDKPKYTFYAEDEPFSDRGFKNLKDVQAFLDNIAPSITALDDSNTPTSIYLRSTLSLISIQTKDGPVDLSRFKLPVTLVH